MEFNEKCPNGLKQSVVLIEKAFFHIMTTDEIYHVIARANITEKAWLKGFKKSFDEARQGGLFENWWDCNWIAIVDAIDSTALLKDILVIAICMDNQEAYRE